MQYCVTLEQTICFVVNFDADSDADAEEKAAKINQEAVLAYLDHEEAERNYALFNRDTNQIILDWG